MQGTFLVIFTLFWSGMTLLFDGFIGHGIIRQFESRNFSSATGAVLRSEVESHSGSKGGTSYSAEIEYRYEVGGHVYTADKLRFNNISSGSSGAHQLVAEHPAGSQVQVFYDPKNPGEALLFPGIKGGDFMLPVFMTPFNMVMLGFWVWIGGWLKGRLAPGEAGGVKIFHEGEIVRARVPAFPPIGWALAVTGGLGFVSVFAVGFPTGMDPSLPVALATLTGIYAAGLTAFGWQMMKIRSGVCDLVVNARFRTLELPPTCGRKERIAVNAADVRSLSVEEKMNRGSKGGTSYTYAPTLMLAGPHAGTQKLADWSDKKKAAAFTEWLRQQLGGSIPATPVPLADAEDEFGLAPVSPEKIVRPEHSRIRVNDVPGGTEFYFPAARNVGVAIFLTVFVMIWSGFLWLMLAKGAPIMFPIVFGLIDVLLVLGLFQAWFKSTRVTVNKTAVRLKSRWFIFSRTREFSAGDYARFATKMGMQSGSKTYLDIKLVRRGADADYAQNMKKLQDAEQSPDEQKVNQLAAARFRQAMGPRGITVASSIANAGEAEWLVREMNRALGRS